MYFGSMKGDWCGRREVWTLDAAEKSECCAFNLLFGTPRLN